MTYFLKWSVYWPVERLLVESLSVENLSYLNIINCYQIEFANLHQLLPIQSDLLHVNGDREHRVGATVQTQNRETVTKTHVFNEPSKAVNTDTFRGNRYHVEMCDHLSDCNLGTWSMRSWVWRQSSSWLIPSPGSDKLHLCCEPSPPPDPSPPHHAVIHNTVKSEEKMQNMSTKYIVTGTE